MKEHSPYEWDDVYDDYATGLPGDVEFYVREATQTDGEVLEIGCGTGRILIPIAEAGVEITGLDITHGMLDVCRRGVEKLPDDVRGRIMLIQGDMRDFDIGKQFALIICPYRAFLHNLTIEDQLSTISCVVRHLASGGCFVMNIFDPWLDQIAMHLGEENASKFRLYRSYIDTNTANHMDVYEKRWYEPSAQILHANYKFVEEREDGSKHLKTTKSLRLRWIYRFEMEHLFVRGGHKRSR